MLPVEAVLCETCGAYLGKAIATMGQPHTLQLPQQPPPLVGRDKHAPVPWDQPLPEVPLAKRRIPQVRWANTKHMSVAVLDHRSKSYSLRAWRNGWKVFEHLQRKGLGTANVYMASGWASSEEAARTTAYNFICDHIKNAT
jgi:hypothetical protein